MHAFMDAVLFRVTGFDELGVDTEGDEPDREPGQPGQCIRGERDAVVGSNTLWQAVLLEESFEVSHCPLKRYGWVGITAQEETDGEITHGEREAVGAIPQTELPLVVGGPDLIGFTRAALRTSRMKPFAPVSRLHQVGIFEDPTDSALRRQRPVRMALGYLVEQG